MTANLGDFLTRRARRDPNLEAMVEVASGTRLTYLELNKRVNKAANLLTQAGVKKGDRVGFLLMNGLPLVETVFAAAKLCAINVSLNWRLTADELEFILKDSGTTTLVFSKEFLPVIKELQSRGDATDITTWIQVGGDIADFADDFDALWNAQSDAEPEFVGGGDDLLFIMYTSGTTGLPKGVMHSHNSVAWGCITQETSLPTQDKERFLITLPMFHVAALIPLFNNAYFGYTSVMTESFDPVKSWEIIRDEKITAGMLVPAMLLAMKAVYKPEEHTHPNLRHVICGAAPVPVSLIKEYSDVGINIAQVYGMTETCGPGCVIIGQDAIERPGSTGRGFFHTDVRIVNAEGNDCKPGEPGEIWMKGPNNMVGYWNRPEATAETLVDGWVLSGDVAVMDEDGFVTIVERLKDMLISGGENVYPAEIENVLLTHDGVADAAVIGVPSEKWGESAMAVVVPANDDVNEQSVIDYTKDKLAGFKSVKVVRFIEEIPRNPSGKILKRALREQYPDVTAPE